MQSVFSQEGIFAQNVRKLKNQTTQLSLSFMTSFIFTGVSTEPQAFGNSFG